MLDSLSLSTTSSSNQNPSIASIASNISNDNNNTSFKMKSTSEKQQQLLSASTAEQLQMPSPSSSSSSSSSNNSNNVIVIKYANVTAKQQLQQDDTNTANEQLSVYKLHGEPLSVSIIESRFANSISIFDVSYNQLSTLSKDLFCPLSNEVRQLNISHNLLENFDCLGLISQNGQLCLSELRSLDMSYNLIKHLPATGVATLHNLEQLDLSHNQIESLHELSLSSLFKLIKLDLSFNKIQQLPAAIFHKSNSLQVLKLQSNSIQTTISQQLLADLVSLEEINLSYNNISQVGDLAFVDKVNLTRVDLTHNQLANLRQEVLKVTLSSRSGSQLLQAQQTNGSQQQQQQQQFKHRLHHNGQYAGSVPTPSTTNANHKQVASNVEFLLSSNPFICDCNLEWLRKYQQPSIKRAGVGHSHHHSDPLGAQLMQLTTTNGNNQYQNDQPAASAASSSPVIHPTASTSSFDPSNNISEMLSGTNNQQANSNRLLSTGSNLATSTTNHYSRIGDLDLIKCSPLFRRNHHQNTNQRNGHNNSHHSKQHRNSVAPYSEHHGRHSQHHDSSTMIDLLTADPSNFLCRYKSHCFALCHCCEFDACDCEMICPTGCSCYYDSTWQTNIIDCSSSNHTVVPDRIPMDVSGLYLDGNNIDSLRPSNLIARKSLKTLYLNSTNLQYIANRTFNGLIELQTLYLNDNQLRTLNGYEFEPLAQLRSLHLQSNRLDHISNQTFIYLRSLETLDLSNNRLTSSNLDLFWSIGHHNIRLRQLSIAHNWWSCQCNSINRFRQILKQKFLLNGSQVNIVDKNQLRCYYNSTTVGPLILADNSQQQQQLQPLYASYGGNNRQQQQQQQLLTEVNQCSDMIDEKSEIAQDVNPPVIYPPPTPMIPDQSVPSGIAGDQSSNDPYLQDPNQQPPSSQSNQQYPSNNYQDQPINDPSAMFNPTLNQILAQHPRQHDSSAPIGLTGGLGGTGVLRSHNGELNGPMSATSMPLTSFILLSVMILGVFAIMIGLFVFIRQQQARFHQSRRHKKSSAASTTSAGSSSSNGSSTIDHSHHHHNIKSATHHRANHLHQAHHHHTLLNGNQHHHLIMNANSPAGNGGAQTLLANHHHHSASSQSSNIYAALVSPTTGNSTIVTSATSQMNLNGIGNNIYSNSSTTASHRSANSNVMMANAIPHQQQPGYWQQANNNQTIYNAASAYASGNLNGALETPYAGYNGAQSQTSYKTGGTSLYNAPGNCHDLNNPIQKQHQNDWIKIPKVKQFMSKLVNKSLDALGGGYRSTNSRDELANITSSDKIYDAFISYDKRDEAFVMQHLSAELEYGQPQYRVADRFRDLPLPTSAYIAEAITSVIGCSHRTIVVLTDNYLASEWCRYELQAALNESLMDKTHKIIAVVLDPKCLLDMDSEMRALLTNANNCPGGNISIYQASQSPQQLVQLDGMDHLQQPQQLVATLVGSQASGSPQVCTQTAQLATSRITFINYNERKFWPKIKQLMPTPRPTTQTLTLTTKN